MSDFQKDFSAEASEEVDRGVDHEVLGAFQEDLSNGCERAEIEKQGLNVWQLLVSPFPLWNEVK